MPDPFSIRLAREEDIEPLELLIPLSVRALQAPFYSSAQMDAALGPVFGVDRQLIADGTYFVVEHSGVIVGCGGGGGRPPGLCGGRPPLPPGGGRGPPPRPPPRPGPSP